MVFSIEVDKSNPTALAYCLKKIENKIDDFSWDWSMEIVSGSIDYGIYLNVYADQKLLRISNQPEGDGDDDLDSLFEYFEEDEDEEIDDED